MPTPRADESRDAFIERCMASDEARRDFPDESQRFAFCQSQYDRGQRDSPMTTEHKTFKAEIKQVSEEGAFEAVIATLGVTDHDGDIIEAGAFRGNDAIAILPTHNSDSVPLGKGRIEERGDQAVVVGQLNLETQPGREWHSHLKFDFKSPPPIQEWSFGFMIEDSATETREGEEVRLLKGLDVFEASPVLLGAGIGTRTVAVKQRFSEQIDAALADVEAIVARAREIDELRQAKGKRLSPERQAQLEALIGKAETLAETIEKLRADEAAATSADSTDDGPSPEEKALAAVSANLTLP